MTRNNNFWITQRIAPCRTRTHDTLHDCHKSGKVLLGFFRYFENFSVVAWSLERRDDIDGDQVEYAGGGADDVDGDVAVAHHRRQAPHAVVELWTTSTSTR
uniref:SFRICE_017077 n=1 Tax=Spodoptera frugiperda TaxID=7108 RepID=A0A2H1W826_SPOFR